MWRSRQNYVVRSVLVVGRRGAQKGRKECRHSQRNFRIPAQARYFCTFPRSVQRRIDQSKCFKDLETGVDDHDELGEFLLSLCGSRLFALIRYIAPTQTPAQAPRALPIRQCTTIPSETVKTPRANTHSSVADPTGAAMASSNFLVKATSSIPLDLIAAAAAEVDPRAQTPAQASAYLELTWSPSCQKILEVYVMEHYKKVCHPVLIQ